MKALSENFKNAAYDYLMLLNKNYPQKAILKLIGDRYMLSGNERSMLFRGLAQVSLANERMKKICPPENLDGQPLAIDTYNVLITIGSYLNGNMVFISNDGMLRDASEIHGKVFRSQIVIRAMMLLFEFLKTTKVQEITFLVDSPVSHSGKLCADLNNLLHENKFHGSALTIQSPDFRLKEIAVGIIATSDSAVIDKTTQKVFDLPVNVLRFHFDPEFIDLRNFSVQ